MSKFKEGEKWQSPTMDIPAYITAVGMVHLLYTYDKHHAPEYSVRIDGLHDWTKTHEADGTPVAHCDNKCPHCNSDCFAHGPCGHKWECGSYQAVTGINQTLGCIDRVKAKAEKPGDRRCEIIWNYKWCEHGIYCDGMNGGLSCAHTLKDFIGFEDDQAHLHGRFRLKYGTGAVHPVISRDAWDSGQWEVVPMVAVILKGGE